jgi:hypothetical protein
LLSDRRNSGRGDRQSSRPVAASIRRRSSSGDAQHDADLDPVVVLGDLEASNVSPELSSRFSAAH